MAETLNERFKTLANNNIEDAKVIEDNANNVDFMDSDFSENISAQKAFNTESHAQQTSDKQTYEEAKENSTDPKQPIMEAADFDLISMFVIEFADAGISNGLRVWSKEKSSKHFEMEGSKKVKLRKMLSLILEKRQAKMSIEFMFFMTLLLFYLAPVKEAMRLRKINKEKEEGVDSNKEETKRTSKYETIKKLSDDEIKTEMNKIKKDLFVKNEETEKSKEPDQIIPPQKRKPGRPRKGEETYKRVANGDVIDFNLTDEELKSGIERNED